MKTKYKIKMHIDKNAFNTFNPFFRKEDFFSISDEE